MCIISLYNVHVHVLFLSRLATSGHKARLRFYFLCVCDIGVSKCESCMYKSISIKLALPFEWNFQQLEFLHLNNDVPVCCVVQLVLLHTHRDFNMRVYKVNMQQTSIPNPQSQCSDPRCTSDLSVLLIPKKERVFQIPCMTWVDIELATSCSWSRHSNTKQTRVMIP